MLLQPFMLALVLARAKAQTQYQRQHSRIEKQESGKETESNKGGVRCLSQLTIAMISSGVSIM